MSWYTFAYTVTNSPCFRRIRIPFKKAFLVELTIFWFIVCFLPTFCRIKT